MFFIFASLIFFVCLLAGWGTGCARLLRQKTDNPWLFPFLGMFAAGTIFTCISLFFPLNGLSMSFFVLIGMAGLPDWIKALSQIPAVPREAAERPREYCLIFWAILFSCLLVLSACFAMKNWTGAYDTDLYHANIVCWLNEYGAVPGLANLHSRLGVNSFWLNLAAVLDNGPWDNRSAWIMPPLLFFCSLAYLAHNVAFSSQRVIRVFCLCMALFIVIQVHYAGHPSLYYDLPAQFVVALLFAECFVLRKNSAEKTQPQFSLPLCLSALAFAIKPIAGVSLLFVSGFALYSLKEARLLRLGNTARAFAPAAAAGAVWVTYNCVLSGYPLFPLPFLPLPMEWTASLDSIKGNYNDIIAWARAPGPGYREALSNWDWLVPWLKRNAASKAFWLACTTFLAALPLWIYALSRRDKGESAFFGAWAMLDMVYWFFTAPDFRFGIVFFQINFAISLALALQTTFLPPFTRIAEAYSHCRFKRALPVACLLIAAIVSEGELRSTRKGLLGVGTIPSKNVTSRVLDDSASPPILLYFPTQGDQCGNSPLPCTPYDNPNILLLQPGDLGGGFTLNKPKAGKL